MAEPAARGNPVWLAALFALAWAGGAVAYMPFLTILLPGRVADLAGPVTGISRMHDSTKPAAIQPRRLRVTSLR